MILIIDNYDSFTFNLYQQVSRLIMPLGQECVVVRNDACSVEDIVELMPSALIISPGPYGPESTGISAELLDIFTDKIPVLGVCLGHELIAHHYGAKIIRARTAIHGKATEITHHADQLFAKLPNPMRVARYHSLIVDPRSLPSCFEIIARSKEDEIMAIRHRDYQLWGVQFHPESFLTQAGDQLMQNFLSTIPIQDIASVGETRC